MHEGPPGNMENCHPLENHCQPRLLCSQYLYSATDIEWHEEYFLSYLTMDFRPC